MSYSYPDNFFYPDDSSDNNLTQHIQNLADSVQAKFTAQETWTGWTPLFYTPANGGTQGGINAVGSGGAVSGHYRRSSPNSRALVYAEFRFVIGTSPTIATGTFVLTLPVPAYDLGGAAFSCQNHTVGEWSLRDNSSSPVNHYTGTLAYYFDFAGTEVHFAGTPQDATAALNSTANQTSRYRMDSNDPITFATSDVLTGHLLYRAN